MPRLPLRDTTPTLPGWNTRGLKAGMMPAKPSPGVTMPAVLGPTMRPPAPTPCSSRSKLRPVPQPTSSTVSPGFSQRFGHGLADAAFAAGDQRGIPSKFKLIQYHFSPR